MEVEYDLTPDDLFAFHWRAAFRSRIGRRARYRVYAYWFLALLLFSAVPAIGPGGFVVSRMNFAFLLVALPPIVLAQWWWDRRLTRRTILQLVEEEKPGKGHLGRHRVVLSEAGVVEITAVNESRTSWAGVDRVEQNSEYIFIYTSPSTAHVIPRRAFRDTQEAEAFYQLGRTRKQAVG